MCCSLVIRWKQSYSYWRENRMSYIVILNSELEVQSVAYISRWDQRNCKSVGGINMSSLMGLMKVLVLWRNILINSNFKVLIFTCGKSSRKTLILLKHYMWKPFALYVISISHIHFWRLIISEKCLEFFSDSYLFLHFLYSLSFLLVFSFSEISF